MKKLGVFAVASLLGLASCDAPNPETTNEVQGEEFRHPRPSRGEPTNFSDSSSELFPVAFHNVDNPAVTRTEVSMRIESLLYRLVNEDLFDSEVCDVLYEINLEFLAVLEGNDWSPDEEAHDFLYSDSVTPPHTADGMPGTVVQCDYHSMYDYHTCGMQDISIYMLADCVSEIDTPFVRLDTFLKVPDIHHQTTSGTYIPPNAFVFTATLPSSDTIPFDPPSDFFVRCPEHEKDMERISTAITNFSWSIRE